MAAVDQPVPRQAPADPGPLRPDPGMHPPPLPRARQPAVSVSGRLRELLREDRIPPGYVEHFLIQDLVDETFTSIRFLRGAGDFTQNPLPAADVDDYREYMTRSMAFIRSRNARIAAYVVTHLR